jgi:hypothetical protein
MSENTPRFRGVRRLTPALLGLLLVLAATLTGCKPDKEPDYPYGKAPAKPEAADAGQGAQPDADAGAAQEPDAGAAQQPDATAAAADAAVGPGPAADATVEGSQDAQARFYALVGLRLVGRTDEGVHRWLFKPTGFFEHELYGKDRVTTRRTGTYKLENGALSLTYKETKRQPAGEQGVTAGEAVQDGSATLPLTAAGKMKLRIGEVEVAVDLDD